MIYNLLKKLLLNNNQNFIKNIIKIYIILLFIKYKIMTSYYFKINEKIENLSKKLLKLNSFRKI